MRQAYFLGGVSAGGFRTRFGDQMAKQGRYTYVLKGGPGTGKSTLMRKVAEAFPEEAVSVYHCASDASSLDAVLLEDRGVIVVDGTAPHVFEAAQPMLSGEIVNLGARLNGEQLRQNAEAIQGEFSENARYHKRSRQYVQAVSALHDDLRTVGDLGLLREKLLSFSQRLTRRIFPRDTGSQGSVSFHQLSALTAEGYCTQPLTGDWQIYLLRDPLFAGSDFLLRAMVNQAQARGLNCRVSENYLLGEPVYEHLLLPDLKLALLSENGCAQPDCQPAQVLNFARFYDKAELARRKKRIAFDQKASRSLLAEAAEAIQDALRVHDVLEQYYIDALDFDGLNQDTKRLLEAIAARTPDANY